MSTKNNIFNKGQYEEKKQKKHGDVEHHMTLLSLPSTSHDVEQCVG